MVHLQCCNCKPHVCIGLSVDVRLHLFWLLCVVYRFCVLACRFSVPGCLLHCAGLRAPKPPKTQVPKHIREASNFSERPKRTSHTAGPQSVDHRVRWVPKMCGGPNAATQLRHPWVCPQAWRPFVAFCGFPLRGFVGIAFVAFPLGASINSPKRLVHWHRLQVVFMLYFSGFNRYVGHFGLGAGPARAFPAGRICRLVPANRCFSWLAPKSPAAWGSRGLGTPRGHMPRPPCAPRGRCGNLPPLQSIGNGGAKRGFFFGPKGPIGRSRVVLERPQNNASRPCPQQWAL